MPFLAVLHCLSSLRPRLSLRCCDREHCLRRDMRRRMESGAGCICVLARADEMVLSGGWQAQEERRRTEEGVTSISNAIAAHPSTPAPSGPPAASPPAAAQPPPATAAGGGGPVNPPPLNP